MELNQNDKKVIDLLSKLKNSNGTYPSDVFAARRQNYLRQIANIGLGIGISAGVKNAVKGGNGAVGTVATVTSKILEIALITAIAIEAGTAAYLYRGKIADLIRKYAASSNVQEVASPVGAESSSSSEVVGLTKSPTPVNIATPSGTVTMTVTATSGTPSPEVANDKTNSSNNNGSTTNINATPNPGNNNGNHYGNTPKPVRTKDNKNNNGGSNNDGGKNNKP